MLFSTLIFLLAHASAFVRASKPVYSLHDHDLEQLFEDFIVKHVKQYDSKEEKQNRFEIFKQNVEKINKRNSDPQETATFDINHFTDLKLEEFKQKYTGFEPLSTIPKHSFTFVNPLGILPALPDTFDWRTKHAVTGVMDQGMCGSSWAFSATGAVEGAYGIKHGSVESFSVQQLVECDIGHGDNECRGGLMQVAIQYIINAGGQMSEADYPYIGVDSYECKFHENKIAVKVTKLMEYNLTGEEPTKNYLVQNGPISIAINAAGLQHYSKGILRSCSDGDINHGVLLVGYGLENGQKYYIIKNSWGTGWGEQGYVRVETAGNPCSMYNDYAAGVQVA